MGKEEKDIYRQMLLAQTYSCAQQKVQVKASGQASRYRRAGGRQRCTRQRVWGRGTWCNQRRAAWLISQEAFISHHPFTYNKLFFGPSQCQDTTKIPRMTVKIRWRKEHSSEYPGAASGWEMLLHQTDNLLSGKQLLFCHTRIFKGGVMLQRQSPLPRAEHRFCFLGKATLSLDGARLLLRPHPN